MMPSKDSMMNINNSKLNVDLLIEQVEDAHARTLTLVEGLTESQMMGPKAPQLNPLRWEIAHAAYFYEYWIIRSHYQQAPYTENVDKLFDSINILHDDRWDLPLPSLDFTFAYMEYVKQKVIAYLSNHEIDIKRDYLTQYAVFHEDMHCEAFTYERQTLAYPTPKIKSKQTQSEVVASTTEKISGDVNIPAGTFYLGAVDNGDFVFDNEKWLHPISVDSFNISRTAVCNLEYLEFVESGGYQNRQYWNDEAWQWLQASQMLYPLYWRKENQQWQARRFDQWLPLDLEAAVMNVSWYEANAYCNWAKRRLPTELEWEVAASAEPNHDGQSFTHNKRRFPWGDSEPTAKHANLEGAALAPISVHALPEGDSAFGCRQMLGNVWEWTSTVFNPYPDFTPDMYADYSKPLFGNTRVMRGGSWATRARLMRNTYRNYYGAERNDVFVGFRTCAL